ncbi:dihydropteroate synthase [Putridiphycobacter roseus]|uniref:dihydropteroate synthase n=1 Tax=Putridiphycobacter roseus TaxID=2219161 RepID=A0A2W1N2K4_9FLAO|nr:dihydropteroate synthase [Putridiphycobacter roseus]PZE17760.1 dihydropteroate synthase [Putridiphycobacter roseus]
MGILNTTPDSFFEGNRVKNEDILLKKAKEMVDAKVDIIDIGGFSSRPGADFVTEEEELSRVLPAIKSIHKKFPTLPISIDTFRSTVADEALKAGACIVNDISGGCEESEIFHIAAKHKAPFIMMHMRGTATNMMKDTTYAHLLPDLALYFSIQINKAKLAGVKDIIIDPGLGFSKTLDQNYEAVKNLAQLKALGHPILIGASRKSMLNKLLNISADAALNATTAINTIACLNGASILRVHDVKEAKETICIVDKMNQV